MSKSVTIPSFNDPFVVEVNNTKYSYPASSTQTVPDEVACVIENINANLPKEAPEDGKPGQVWTKEEKSATWKNFPIELPQTGNTGDFLKKTASGCEWATAPGKTLYNHCVYIAFTDAMEGDCNAYINLVNSSPTALTLTTLKTWIAAHGAKSSANDSYSRYPASGQTQAGTLAQKIYVNGDTFILAYGSANDVVIPSDATLYDNVNEI